MGFVGSLSPTSCNLKKMGLLSCAVTSWSIQEGCGFGRCHFSSFIFLHTNVRCPVFESILVVRGRQLQVTVLAFSCFTTTQFSINSAFAGGIWLRIGGGGGAAATGGFFAAHPARSRQATTAAFLITNCFRSLAARLSMANLVTLIGAS